ncbi:hypothetical protein ACFQ7F_31975 [Streptomyces sp. NPDC056486]|uniref:hypothetical protein n=1 Tax=Streptomyces sp. NPDC056486 TaxID=3345835 RepID=UPI0036B4615C
MGAVFTTLALGLSVILYASVDGFYRQFEGMPLEWAGLDAPTLLWRAAPMALIVSFMLTVVSGLFAALVMWLAQAPTDGTLGGFVRFAQKHMWVRTALLALPSALLISIPAFGEGQLVSDGTGAAMLLIFWWLLFGLAVGVVPLVVPQRFHRPARVAVALAMALSISGIWAVGVMEERGARTERTGQVGFAEQAIGLRFQYVRVTVAKMPGHATEEPFFALYLGESGGIQTLYDCSRGELRRLPVPSVRMAIDTDGRAAAAVQWACQAQRHSAD